MKKLLSIFLVLWMLISSMAISIGTHFCGNELKSIALFGKATPCHHAQPENGNLPACHSHKKSSEDSSDCCNDKWLELETLEIETTLSQWSLIYPDLEEITALAPQTEVLLPEPIFGAPKHYLNYKPPLLAQDFSVFHQQFLI